MYNQNTLLKRGAQEFLTMVVMFTHRGSGGTETRSSSQHFQVSALHCHLLFCTSLQCTVYHCTALYSTLLHDFALHCSVLYSTVIMYVTLHCISSFCTLCHFTALHCTALHCGPRFCLAHQIKGEERADHLTEHCTPHTLSADTFH